MRDEIFMNTTVHVSFYKIMCTLKITQLKADVDYKGSQYISDVFLLSVDHDKNCFYIKFKDIKLELNRMLTNI